MRVVNIILDFFFKCSNPLHNNNKTNTRAKRNKNPRPFSAIRLTLVINSRCPYFFQQFQAPSSVLSFTWKSHQFTCFNRGKKIFITKAPGPRTGWVVGGERGRGARQERRNVQAFIFSVGVPVIQPGGLMNVGHLTLAAVASRLFLWTFLRKS